MFEQSNADLLKAFAINFGQGLIQKQLPGGTLKFSVLKILQISKVSIRAGNQLKQYYGSTTKIDFGNVQFSWVFANFQEV